MSHGHASSRCLVRLKGVFKLDTTVGRRARVLVITDARGVMRRGPHRAGGQGVEFFFIVPIDRSRRALSGPVFFYKIV